MSAFGEIDLTLDGDTVTIAFDREADWWVTDSDQTHLAKRYADLIQSKVNAEFEGMGYVRRMDPTLATFRRTRCQSSL